MSVAASASAPPGPIPNPVVTRRSAGEYCRGDPVGGEAVADIPDPRSPHTTRHQTHHQNHVPRGGAAAARWAHNPKVEGSNPSPATKTMQKLHHRSNGPAVPLGDGRAVFRSRCSPA
jgi:hypothetical protein